MVSMPVSDDNYFDRFIADTPHQFDNSSARTRSAACIDKNEAIGLFHDSYVSYDLYMKACALAKYVYAVGDRICLLVVAVVRHIAIVMLE